MYAVQQNALPKDGHGGLLQPLRFLPCEDALLLLRVSGTFLLDPSGPYWLPGSAIVETVHCDIWNVPLPVLHHLDLSCSAVRESRHCGGALPTCSSHSCS